MSCFGFLRTCSTRRQKVSGPRSPHVAFVVMVALVARLNTSGNKPSSVIRNEITVFNIRFKLRRYMRSAWACPTWGRLNFNAWISKCIDWIRHTGVGKRTYEILGLKPDIGQYQWRIQNFPEGGAPTPKGWRQLIIWPIFPENCMKMKNFLRRGPLNTLLKNTL